MKIRFFSVFMLAILSCKSISNKKIDEPLDDHQIDHRLFFKRLLLNKYGVYISTTGKGSIKELTILPFARLDKNKKVTLDIDGAVVDAEINDLDFDGFPEILIFTSSAGSGSYGDVIAYSVDAKSNMNLIDFPSVSSSKKASLGYMGHDTFAIEHKALIQRFKTYNKTDSNSKPTGNWRQIRYKLLASEASKKFIIDTITEYPQN